VAVALNGGSEGFILNEVEGVLKMLLKGTASVLAIIAISVIEVFAINKGLDGIILTLAIGAIAGLGGYNIAKVKELVTTVLKKKSSKSV
jgi:hypothetical protein